MSAELISIRKSLDLVLYLAREIIYDSLLSVSFCVILENFKNVGREAPARKEPKLPPPPEMIDSGGRRQHIYHLAEARHIISS